MKKYFGQGKYILTMTAKRKNAKRHIVARSNDLDELRKFHPQQYINEIYDSHWNLIEVIPGRPYDNQNY